MSRRVYFFDDVLPSIRKIIFSPVDFDQEKHLNSKQDILCQYLELAFKKYFDYLKITNNDDKIRFVKKILTLYNINTEKNHFSDTVIAFLSEDLIAKEKKSKDDIVKNLKEKIVFLNLYFSELDKNTHSSQKKPLLKDFKKEFEDFCSQITSVPTPSYRVDEFSPKESRAIDSIIAYCLRNFKINDRDKIIIKNLLLQEKRNGKIADEFFCDRAIKESTKIKKIKECWFRSSFFKSKFLRKNREILHGQFFIKNHQSDRDREDFQDYCYFIFVKHSLGGRFINMRLSSETVSELYRHFYKLSKDDFKKLQNSQQSCQIYKDSPRTIFYKVYDDVRKNYNLRGSLNLIELARRQKLFDDYLYNKFFNGENIVSREFINRDFQRRNHKIKHSTYSPIAQSLSLLPRLR